jgi:hypothetical protein
LSFYSHLIVAVSCSSAGCFCLFSVFFYSLPGAGGVKHNGMATGETAGVFLVHIRIVFLSFVAPPRLGFRCSMCFTEKRARTFVEEVASSKAKQSETRKEAVFAYIMKRRKMESILTMLFSFPFLSFQLRVFSFFYSTSRSFFFTIHPL